MKTYHSPKNSNKRIAGFALVVGILLLHIILIFYIILDKESEVSMKIKELTAEEKEHVAGIRDNQGDYYAITEGYLDPKEYLPDKKDVKKVRKALKVIAKYLSALPSYATLHDEEEEEEDNEDN